MQYNRDYSSSSKCDPCAPDNSSSGYYGGNSKEFDTTGINYGYVKNSFSKLHEGTIYLLKLVEKKGFNEDGIFEMINESDCVNFLKKYGKDLPDICEQLYNANISSLTYSKWDYIVLSKLTMDNAGEQYISFYYDTTKYKNEQFLIDVNEMAMSGFYLRNFARIRTRDSRTDKITYHGYLATFVKNLKN